MCDAFRHDIVNHIGDTNRYHAWHVVTLTHTKSLYICKCVILSGEFNSMLLSLLKKKKEKKTTTRDNVAFRLKKSRPSIKLTTAFVA